MMRPASPQVDHSRLMDVAALALRRARLGVVLSVVAVERVGHRWAITFEDIGGASLTVPVPWHRSSPLQTSTFLERELPKRFAELRGLRTALALSIMPLAALL